MRTGGSLHGFDRDYARVKINEFIRDNRKMGNCIIVIVHGIGSGVLKKETDSTLKKNKNIDKADESVIRGNAVPYSGTQTAV